MDSASFARSDQKYAAELFLNIRPSFAAPVSLLDIYREVRSYPWVSIVTREAGDIAPCPSCGQESSRRLTRGFFFPLDGFVAVMRAESFDVDEDGLRLVMGLSGI